MSPIRWLSVEHMDNDLSAESLFTRFMYKDALLYDYASFVNKFNTPISLDTFVSLYWNVITIESWCRLIKGDIVYGTQVGYPLKEQIVHADLTYNEELESSMCECIETSTGDIWSAVPGYLYSSPYAFDKIAKGSLERMVKQCQMQTHLITKTSPPQS